MSDHCVNHLTFSDSILVNRTSNGVVSSDDLLLTYKSIHQDVRAAVDWVHLKVSLLVYGKLDVCVFACLISWQVPIVVELRWCSLPQL